MKNYIEIYIQHITEMQQEILIALLENIGFSGFETNDNDLKAFVEQSGFNEATLNELAQDMGFTYTLTHIAGQNWNALWESNFEPVTVDDFVTIRAAFHEPAQATKYEILITPKMSFGTGHHATTFMMVQQMRALDFKDKAVLDFGTGTGVLAILAEKSGARNITAIDNDDWSIENARENIIANNAAKIIVDKAENASSALRYDIILANINKNVITENAATLNEVMNPSAGCLLLSGLLGSDEEDIIDLFSAFGLRHVNTQHKAQWISMLWSRG